MTLSKETALGTISLSNVLFAQLITSCLQSEVCSGKAWPATKRGRQIGSDDKWNLSDLAGAIEVEQSLDGEHIDLEFNLIIKFGTSIRKLTDQLADQIAEILLEKSGKQPNQIKIRIVGVKSRQIARRNLEVIKAYGIE